MEEQEREEFFKLIDKVWEANQQVCPEQVASDVAEAVQEARKPSSNRGSVPDTNAFFPS